MPFDHHTPSSKSLNIPYTNSGSHPWLSCLVLWTACWLGLASASEATQITGLESPNSFVGDQEGKEYFISNINGEPDARDNNGFITKLDTEGKITKLKFIQGGVAEVLLHAPKGMALVGQTLYVADLDQLKGFDKTTGKLLLAIPFAAASTQPVSLTDVTLGPGGLLYASDQAANSIYKIDSTANHRVSLFIHDDRLAGPAGIAVHPTTNHLIAVSWDKGKILDITPEGGLTELVSNGFFTSRFQNLSGVDFDRWGNMYVSDFTKGKIWRITRDQRFQVIAEYLPAPADISIDRAGNLILVPYHYAHAAEMNGLEAPTDGKPKVDKRTLADYGFVPPPKPAPEGPAKK
jgi:DNA-binding beta-propeller fold protein YncE